mgnify:CR=1 FL=1
MYLNKKKQKLGILNFVLLLLIISNLGKFFNVCKIKLLPINPDPPVTKSFIINYKIIFLKGYAAYEGKSNQTFIAQIEYFFRWKKKIFQYFN